MQGKYQSEKLAGLQALRGIAVLCVYVYHLFWYASMIAEGPNDTLNLLALSSIGVFSFFGLSGYLITSKATDHPIKFLLDRARRIYPAFWGAILFALCVLAIIGPGGSLSVYTVFLLPSGEVENVSLPYWSLVFEVLFYAVALTVALAARRYAAIIYAAWAVAILCFYKTPVTFMESAYPGNWQTFLFSIYNLYFVAGYFAGMRVRPSREKAWWYALAAIVIFEATPLLLLVGAGGIIGWLYQYDFGYLSAALGVFFIVRAALLWEPGKWVRHVLVRFGDVSYGIYLLHMPTALLMVTALKATGWPTTFWTAFAILLPSALIPGYLYGLLDVWSQRLLKRWQGKILFRASQRRVTAQA